MFWFFLFLRVYIDTNKGSSIDYRICTWDVFETFSIFQGFENIWRKLVDVNHLGAKKTVFIGLGL